jgi:hypothetical protein
MPDADEAREQAPHHEDAAGQEAEQETSHGGRNCRETA